jgi:hypothetical protein
MKVYVGKVCYDDGDNFWYAVEKVFDDEVKALLWKEETFTIDPNEWREYEEMEVE